MKNIKCTHIQCSHIPKQSTKLQWRFPECSTVLCDEQNERKKCDERMREEID